MNEPLPDTLYHYTDIHALQGIWEKGAIWGTESLSVAMKKYPLVAK
ncbi:hypothetical protein MPNTM1_03709 [Mycolicibacterium parafortuitum]